MVQGLAIAPGYFMPTSELDFLRDKYSYICDSVSGRFTPGSIFYGRNEDSFKLAPKDVSDVIPTYLFDQSKFRPNGFMLWDMIMTTLSRVDIAHGDEGVVKPIKPEVYWNKLWLDTKFDANRRAYSYFTKDSIALPYHLDLSKEIGGFELFKAIHSLSHRWADPIAVLNKQKYWKYVYTKWLPYAAANAAVSILYDRGIYTDESRINKLWAIPVTNGLRIYPSTAVNNTKFYVPVSDLTSYSNIDKLFGCVFVYVFIQAPPTRFEDPIDVHKFSLGPVRMLVAGWESIDFILNCPIVFVNKQKCVSVDVSDLCEPHTLTYYYKQRDFAGFPKEGNKFLEWSSTEGLNAELRCPPLPDRQCSIFLNEFEDKPIPGKTVIAKERYKRHRKDLFDKIKSVVIEYEQSILATYEEKKGLRSHRAECNKGYKYRMDQLKLQKKKL